jgi:hypothetical protein
LAVWIGVIFVSFLSGFITHYDMMQNPEQGAQRFWSKPHTDSGAYRTLIPE